MNFLKKKAIYNGKNNKIAIICDRKYKQCQILSFLKTVTLLLPHRYIYLICFNVIKIGKIGG